MDGINTFQGHWQNREDSLILFRDIDKIVKILWSVLNFYSKMTHMKEENTKDTR